MSKNKNIATFGTYDLMHSGHFNLFFRIYELGNLYVGVSLDSDIKKNKGIITVNKTEIRLEEVSKLVIVKEAVAISRNIDDRIKWLKKNNISEIIMGSDHINNENLLTICNKTGINYKIIDRTNGISSSLIKKRIFKNEKS